MSRTIMSRHNIIKSFKTRDKDKILKAVKENKCITYRTNKMIENFSSETTDARRQQNNLYNTK